MLELTFFTSFLRFAYSIIILEGATIPTNAGIGTATIVRLSTIKDSVEMEIDFRLLQLVEIDVVNSGYGPKIIRRHNL